MNKLLKQIIPLSIKHRIKLGSSYFDYKKRIDCIEDGTEVNLLLGTPLHKNLGDHLIALSELDFLKSNRVENLVEIPMSVFWCFKSELIKKKMNISKVFISGGGWMGSLWTEDEKAMVEMIDLFKGRSGWFISSPPSFVL